MTAPGSLPPPSAAELSIGVLRVDRDDRLGYANPAALAMLGTAAVRLAPLPALGPLGLRIAELCDRVRQEGRRLVDREAQGADGPVDLILTPEDDAAECVLVELAPVGWHVRAQAGRHAESQQAAFRQMLRSLGHELKNPLGGLRGAAQLLARQLTDPDLAEYCDVIVAEADRLTALIDRLAEESGPRPSAPLNVHAVLERVCQLAAARGGAEIVRDYDPSIPEIVGDRDSLIQAMLNLVNNAVEAGARRIVLRSRVRRRGPEHAVEPAPWVALEVEDDGPGVDEDLSPLIFYPMVTGKAEGTGLGLSVAQAVAARHGGMLDFTSRPGRTVFTLFLPLDRDG